MRRVFETVAKVAATDASVLLLGEHGTGKEGIAQWLHAQSHRAAGPFVAVDLGALTETLFESELFGYVKGAFTGAGDDRPGRFEAAQGGTLLLDEIGNLSLAMQAKLLSVLQQRRLVRVGGHTPIDLDLRLVAATNRPLREMVAQRSFRQDLLYRLNTVEIHLPPLRARTGDIPLLAAHYTQHYARHYDRPVAGLSPAALRLLQAHPWPGNVRELRHAIERAVILSTHSHLQPGDFALDTAPPEGLYLPTLRLDEAERLLIQAALDKHGGNITRAAAELGITRPALYRRLQKPA
ncbi:MAG: hypothetical protein OHK0039_39920 [Bacteroidia bacterium]